MKGFYRFSENGSTLGEFPNVITSDGKTVIAKYLGGLVGSYAGAIAVGSGTASATGSDKSLEYEFARSPIVVRNVSGPSSGIYQVSFKAVLPSQLEGVITESGLISQEFNKYSGAYGDKLLSRFVSNEGWIVSSSSGFTQTYESQDFPLPENGNAVRVGGESLRLKSTAGSASITMDSYTVQGDFSGYSSIDQFALGYSGFYVSSGTTVEVRFYSDSDRYFTTTVSLDAQTSNSWEYKIKKFNKSQFQAVGSPDWQNIIKSSITASTNSSSTEFIIDVLSLFDTDYINPDYVMTSRSSGNPPVFKKLGKTMDVEYFLEFIL